MKLAVRQTEKKEYIVQVTIGEARNLKAVDSSGLCDPFIRITVANLPPQVTDPEEKTTSVSWNQTFTFSGSFSLKLISKRWKSSLRFSLATSSF